MPRGGFGMAGRFSRWMGAWLMRVRCALRLDMSANATHRDADAPLGIIAHNTQGHRNRHACIRALQSDNTTHNAQGQCDRHPSIAARHNLAYRAGSAVDMHKYDNCRPTPYRAQAERRMPFAHARYDPAARPILRRTCRAASRYIVHTTNDGSC